MKSKIISLRSFLERNKIFFEVLTATALTLTGIFVSFNANSIANKANSISDSQTKIMELENTPRIEIHRTELYIDSIENKHITKWLVFNNNSKISNFQIEKEVSYLVTTKKNHQEVDIPLVKYLDDQEKLSVQNEGLIYEFDNKHCYEDEYLTSKEISDFGDIYIKSFIKISYNNVLGKKEIKFFQILPLIQEIPKKNWESTQADWLNKSDNAIHLKDVEKNITQIRNYK